MSLQSLERLASIIVPRLYWEDDKALYVKEPFSAALLSIVAYSKISVATAAFS